MKFSWVIFLGAVVWSGTVLAKLEFPSELACQIPSDCQVIRGTCGWDIANQSVAAKREAENLEKATHTDCAAGPSKRRPDADCVSGICFLHFSEPPVDEESECRELSAQLTSIFAFAAQCEKDKDCTQSFFSPLYQCRTAFNTAFGPPKRLPLLNRYYEHCKSVHLSGFESEDRCQALGWKAKCQSGKCVAEPPK